MSGTGDVTGGNIANYQTESSRAHYGEVMRGLFPIEDELIRQYFPVAPARVLDLGCGAARTTVVLHERGYVVTGIDLADGLLDHARRKHPALDLRHMDATALTFADATFDAAIFSYNGIDCIYPEAARERCLAEVWRTLRPGGIFLLSSHNAIGAMLSGGLFYLRGYRNAGRWLAQQWGNTYLREWYWRYEDSGGVQYLYSAPPPRTVAQAAAAGFVAREVRGVTGERNSRRIAMHEQHVNFVLQKP